MVDKIPLAKLDDGFKKCYKNIEKLLKSSELLQQSKYYSSAISLSILALEENAKLNLIFKCVKEKHGITEDEGKIS